jgi:uncharacterized protein (DUF488 family)
MQIWTIGHSTRSFGEFLALLQRFEIKQLADVRSFPGSRRYPQFNTENLSVALEKNQIKYLHIRELGGRRKIHPDSLNVAWRNPSFRAYADYMETPEFLVGIEKLTTWAKEARTAYMCSEAVWWRCHRSMISDYLKAQGWTVWHIMGDAPAKEHPYTSPAQVREGKLSYKVLFG